MSEWLTIAALRGSLLLAAAALVWRLLPATRPGLRRKVALVVLVGALGSPWLPQVWEVAPSVGAGMALRAEGARFWWDALLGLWGAGAAAMIIRDAAAAIRLAGILRRSRPAPALARFAFASPIRRSREIESPCLAGFFRPVLLVPLTANQWSTATWRCVLAHEGQHLRQRDPWALWLGRAVLAVYWWQPLAHWLVRQFELETEIGCDSVVVDSGTPIRDYAEVLLALADRHPTSRFALRMSEPSRLRLRLGRMLARSTAEGRATRWRRVTALGVLLGIGGWVSVCGLKSPTPDPAPAAANPDPAARRTEAATRLSANPFPGD